MAVVAVARAAVVVAAQAMVARGLAGVIIAEAHAIARVATFASALTTAQPAAVAGTAAMAAATTVATATAAAFGIRRGNR